MSIIIPLELQRKCEQRWAARFPLPVAPRRNASQMAKIRSGRSPVQRSKRTGPSLQNGKKTEPRKLSGLCGSSACIRFARGAAPGLAVARG